MNPETLPRAEADARLDRFCTIFSKASAIAAMVMGLIVITGWYNYLSKALQGVN